MKSAAVVALLAGAALTGRAEAQFPANPPAGVALRPFHVAAPVESTLSNGLKLVVIESHKLPLVGVALSLPAGSKHDPAAREGVASLLAALMPKTTTGRSADQMAADLDAIGATVTADVDMDYLTLSAGALTENAGRLFDLLGDIVQHPGVRDGDLDDARQRYVAALQHSKSDPAALAERFFAGALYGDHPYGRRPTAASVSAITRADLTQFAATWVKPGGAVLVVAGDVRPAEVQQLAERALNGWKGTIPTAADMKAPAARPTHIVLVNRPGAVQSGIMMGNLTLPVSDNRQDALIIGNRILGEGNDSRLVRDLRDQKRVTGEAHSEISRRREMTNFVATTEVGQPATDQAVSEINGQIRRMRGEVVSDSELTRAKRAMVGSFPRQMETVQQLASQILALKQLGLPDDYLKAFRDRVSALSAKDVMGAMAAATHPDSEVIVVAGDGQKVYEKLKAIAPVEILNADGKALAVEDLSPKPGALDVDRSQFVSRRDSFIVIVQGNPLGTFTSETAVAGDSLVYHESLSIPVARWNLDTRARLSLSKLEMRGLDQTGAMTNQQADTHLTFGAGRVKGHAQIPQPGGTPKVATWDTTVAAGAIDQYALSLVVPALPLEPQTSYTILAFDAADASVKPVQVTVMAVGNLGVPAGVFSVSQVQVMGPQPVILYITRDTPRRIVKIERMGQPMSFELVK